MYTAKLPHPRPSYPDRWGKLRPPTPDVSATSFAMIGRALDRQGLPQAPDTICLMTDQHGIIRAANRPATAVFTVGLEYLIGRHLILYLSAEEHTLCVARLAQLLHDERPQVWTAQLKPWRAAPFAAHITALLMPNYPDQPTQILWLFREMTWPKPLRTPPLAAMPSWA